MREKHRKILKELILYVLTTGVFLSMIYVLNTDIQTINMHHRTMRDLFGAHHLKKVSYFNSEMQHREISNSRFVF